MATNRNSKGEKRERYKTRIHSLFFLTLLIFLTSATSGTETRNSFAFPKDHGFHPEYALEWCYFVGNLHSGSHKFGYELSFFKVILNQTIRLYPVHFAISDLTGGRYASFDETNREIGGLAGNSASKIFSGDFSVEFSHNSKFKILAKPRSTPDYSLEFSLSPGRRDPVLVHGENGKSEKSRKHPDYYSYYYSVPSLVTTGKLRFAGIEYKIESGYSWMDHEWSSKLRPDREKQRSLIGKNTSWDWLGMRLEDGTEIMAFNFRSDEAEESETFGTIRFSDRKIRTFSHPGEIRLVPGSKIYESPQTGIHYPMVWYLSGKDWHLKITSRLPRQEFIPAQKTIQPYWEGAVSAKGYFHGKKVSGEGYLELKGYR